MNQSIGSDFMRAQHGSSVALAAPISGAFVEIKLCA
jgi:hypothetical protein